MKKQTKKPARQAKQVEIEPCTFNPLRLSACIFVQVDSVAEACQAARELIASGYFASVGAETRTVRSAMPSLATPTVYTKGKNEIAYNAKYGRFRSFTSDKEKTLGIAGLNREAQIARIMELRDNGRLTKSEKPPFLYSFDGMLLGSAMGNGEGESANLNVPTTETDIDPDEVV